MTQYPTNEILDKQIQAWNDPAFRQRLYDSAPDVQFFGLKSQARPLNESDERIAREAGIDTYKLQNPGWFNLGKVDALNEIKPKESAIRSQLPIIQASELRQNQLQEYQINRQQDLQRDNFKMQLENFKELAEQQGKLNLRQSMFDMVNNAQAFRMWK